VNGNILNSKGIHVGVVVGDEVFGLKGQKLYDLKGSNIQAAWSRRWAIGSTFA
jgi:hypothetical protein